MVEGARLESVCRGNSTEGSNPSLSAIRLRSRVIAREGDETFEADPETERMLLDSIAQCDRGETIPLTQLLGELRDRE